MAKPAPITIPTEPIGSIPRPADLNDRVEKGDADFVGLTAPIDPHIETQEEVRDRSLEPGVNYRWCYADGLFLIEARRDCFAWQPDGVTWLP
jgi:hypothetical protein